MIFVFGNNPGMSMWRALARRRPYSRWRCWWSCSWPPASCPGTGAGFVALTLLAFEPNLLAHGAYVTTDVALSFVD